MKKIFLSMISMLTMGIATQAQQAWMIDSVSIGASAQDEYYSLKNGSQRIENSKNWHLGFTLSPIGDSAGVWANHQNGNAYTKVFNIKILHNGTPLHWQIRLLPICVLIMIKVGIKVRLMMCQVMMHSILDGVNMMLFRITL
jgi:hypothetical protein